MPRQRDVDPAALREARIAAGLTQHELARLVGVAGGERISRWELGTSTPRPAQLQRLAEALGVPPAELLARTQGSPDLRRLRMAAGLSTRELAARAHMSAPTLARWESGGIARIPDRAALEPLARAMARPVEDVERALEESRRRRVALLEHERDVETMRGFTSTPPDGTIQDD